MCEDCAANQELQSQAQWYDIQRGMVMTTMVYVWVWPVVLVTLFATPLSSAVSDVVATLLWFFVVFWLYPSQGIPRSFKGWETREDELRNEMFLLKMGGSLG